MTVSVETITDKIDTILTAEGFDEQPTATELTGNPTWAKWDAEKEAETLVILHTYPTAHVVVGFIDKYGKQISSSGKFYVGAENVWVYFENTLKLAIKGF
jgi:hypothetical protein